MAVRLRGGHGTAPRIPLPDPYGSADIRASMGHAAPNPQSSPGPVPPVGRPWSERVRQQLAVQLVLVDVEPARLEPAAHVGAVAEQEVHRLRVADQVDDLREV